MKRRTALAAALLVTLVAREAHGEPPLHIKTPSTLVTDGGSKLRLPPGYFYDEGQRDMLDIELRRLQEQETRLTAENSSLRDSAGSWSPGWRFAAVAFTVGSAIGAYTVWRLAE
jgi:hypothetical protein